MRTILKRPVKRVKINGFKSSRKTMVATVQQPTLTEETVAEAEITVPQIEETEDVNTDAVIETQATEPETTAVEEEQTEDKPKGKRAKKTKKTEEE